MSEQVNAVRTGQEATAFAAEWDSLLRAFPAIRDGIEIPRSRLLTESVALLVKHGWDVKMAMSQNAQLEKRRTMRRTQASLMICIFSVLGMLAVMIRIASAGRERIHLQVQNNGHLQVIHAGRNIVITDLGELEQIATSSQRGISYLMAAAIGLASVIFWAGIIHIL